MYKRQRDIRPNLIPRIADEVASYVMKKGKGFEIPYDLPKLKGLAAGYVKKAYPNIDPSNLGRLVNDIINRAKKEISRRRF